MNTIAACILCAMLSLSGCSGSDGNPLFTSIDSIQSDLDHDPVLHDKGYTVMVESLDHGYVTLVVKGLRAESVQYLMKGKTLGDIIMNGEWNARALADTEEMLKKRPDVKGVKWVPAS